MKQLTIILTTRIISFAGTYRRDLEKPNWHYYETALGDIVHIRKSEMMAVLENAEKNNIIIERTLTVEKRQRTSSEYKKKILRLFQSENTTEEQWEEMADAIAIVETKWIANKQRQYQKSEYCKSINCPAYEDLVAGNKDFCKENCGAYRFHTYLINNGYKIVKREIKK